MNQTNTSGSLRRHEYELDKQQKKARDRERMFISRAIDRGQDARAAGDWESLADICASLEGALSISAETLWFYDTDETTNELPWHYGALCDWFEASNPGFEPSETAQYAFRESGFSEMVGFMSAVFESLETAAVVDGPLDAEFEDRQQVFGFEGQLGERYVRPESSVGGDLNIRDKDDELKSILCAGGKGSGKSTAVESLAMDSYAHGHKIVDLVDFMKSENAVYDIPQQDNGEGLIEAREDMGLPIGFDDLEAGCAWLFSEEIPDDLVTSPNLEIYVPLTPGLAEMDVPTIPNVDEATVKPFTIPASDLTYRQLVMLLHHTTTARENHLRTAHQKLRDTMDNWTLADVAEAVKHETNAGDKMASQIETSLRTAQSNGFVRDRDCPHALDWTEVMADQDTITAFSVHTVKEKSDRLMVLSYLIDSLHEARRNLIKWNKLHQYPPMTIVMREMHEVAPRTKAEQDSESVIESYMIDTLSELFALTRHADLEILSDTQKFYRQLSPEVSGLFDHILAFRGYIPDVKRIFKTRTDTNEAAERVAQFKNPGRCAFISEGGPKWPIQIAPPRNHHLEASTDGSGLGFRARVDETPDRMLPAPWSPEIPDRLSFDDVTQTPLEMFFEQYITETGNSNDYAVKQEITNTYNQWAEQQGYDKYEGQGGHIKLHKALKNYIGLSSDTDAARTIGGRRRQVHTTITLQEPIGIENGGEGTIEEAAD